MRGDTELGYATGGTVITGILAIAALFPFGALFAGERDAAFLCFWLFLVCTAYACAAVTTTTAFGTVGR